MTASDELDDAIDAGPPARPEGRRGGARRAREIECGVLQAEGWPPDVSVVAEIVVRGEHEFYDFEAKYLDGATRLDVPRDVPEEVGPRIRQLAARAFDALSCEGLARVDFFLTPTASSS